MATTPHEKVIRTVCRMQDLQCCGILAHVKDGVLVKVEPADNFPEPRMKHICVKCLASIQLPYNPERIQYPMKRVGKRGGSL